MHKITVFSFVLSCLFTVALGQNAHLTVGNSFHKPKSWGDAGEFNHRVFLRGKTPDGYYLFEMHEQLSSNPGSHETNALLTFEKYDDNFNSVLQKTIETEKLISDNKVEMIHVYPTNIIGDSIYLLYSIYNRKAKTKDMMIMSCHQNNLEFSTSRKLLSITDLKDVAKTINANYNDPEESFFFDIGYSPDSSKTLISYNRGDNPRVGRIITVQVWAGFFESLLWEKELTTESKESGEYARAMLDNDANIYMKIITFKKDVNVKEQMLSITQFGQQLDWKTIDIRDNNLVGETYHFDEYDKFFMRRYYREKDMMDLTGTYSYDFSLSSQKYKPMMFIPKDTIEKDTRKKDARTGWDKFYQNSPLMESVISLSTKDGGKTQLYEEIQWQIGSLGYRNGKPVYTPEYRYSDIIVKHLDKGGNILWNIRIPKRQMEEQYVYKICSFSLQCNGENVEFFYNELEDNGEDSKKLAIFKIPMKENDKGALVKVTIKPDGTYKKEILYKFGKEDAIPMVQTMRFISKNEAILGICKDFSFTIGKLSW